MRKAKPDPCDPLEHLKVLKIVCYDAHISDFKIVAYIIKRAVQLKKIVVDPRWEDRGKVPSMDFIKKEKAARTSAKRQLKSLIMPDQGVELVIL